MSTTIVEFLCLYAPRPTELDDALRVFEELSVVNCGFDELFFFSGRNLKSAYISSFICMFSN